jgi:hypothetical protein
MPTQNDYQRLWEKLSHRPARIDHVLALLGWHEEQLKGVVERFPDSFRLSSMRGAPRGFWLRGKRYTHIARAEQEPERTDPAVADWWQECTGEARQEVLL